MCLKLANLLLYVHITEHLSNFFSEIALPLTELTKKTAELKWTPTCQMAFDTLKECLIRPEVMAYPHYQDQFILDTDASDKSIGGILSQIQDGQERVIGYASRTMNKSEKNYCVTDKELLAVKFFIEYFRQYLIGRRFIVRSDHQALKWLFSLKEPKGRIARWIEILSAFDFSVEYRAGKKHQNADALSRCPNVRECKCITGNVLELKCGPCRKCRKRTDQDQLEVSCCRQIKEPDRNLPSGAEEETCSGNTLQKFTWEVFYWVVAVMIVLLRSWTPIRERLASRVKYGYAYSKHNTGTLKIVNKATSWTAQLRKLIEKRTHPQECSKTGGHGEDHAQRGLKPQKTDGRERPKVNSICRTRQQEKNVKSNLDYWELGTTQAELQRFQTEDPAIGVVKEWKISDKRPFGPKICSASSEVRHYWNCWKSLEIHEGLLFKRFYKQDGTNSYLQFLVPEALRENVLRVLHNSSLAGHLGKKKTVARILQRFYWFELQNDVQAWIKRCDLCAKNKPNPKPLTPRGNRYILTVSDNFSKWIEIFAIPDQTNEKCADKIFNEVICRYGCPLDIHSVTGDIKAPPPPRFF